MGLSVELGRGFDLSLGIAPLDLQTARTGLRMYMRDADAATILLIKGAGTAGDDPTLTLQQHTAYTSGTSANLSTIDTYWIKRKSAALTGAETWEEITQTASHQIVDPGGDTTSAEEAMLVAIPVSARDLTNGYEWVSLNVGDTGSNAQLGCVLYIPHSLTYVREPSGMPEWLTGTVA